VGIGEGRGGGGGGGGGGVLCWNMVLKWHKDCGNVTLRFWAATIRPYVFNYKPIYFKIQIVLSTYFSEPLGITHFKHKSMH
jgi:hypothetical protein